MEQRYLRVMELGEILDLSVRLYRKNLLPLVTAQLPLTVAVFFVLIMGGGTSIFDIFSQSPSYMDPSIELYFIVLLFSLFQSILVLPLVLGAVTKVASDCILKESPSVKEAYKFALQNKGKLIVTNFIISFAIGLVTGMLISVPVALITFAMMSGSSSGVLLGVPIALLMAAVGVIVASFLWIRWVTTFPILVNEEDEDYGSLDAMKRSWNLVQGHTRKLFFVMIAVTLIPTLIEFSPFALEFLTERSLAYLTVFSGVIALGIVGPLVHCARVVIYFELKTRKEGFDLEKRVEELSSDE